MQSTEASVLSIIAAFGSGLEVFKRLNERRRQHRQESPGKPSSSSKNRKPTRTPSRHGEKSSDELRLSESLRRGSADVQMVYEGGFRKAGTRFALGDGELRAIVLAHKWA